MPQKLDGLNNSDVNKLTIRREFLCYTEFSHTRNSQNILFSCISNHFEMIRCWATTLHVADCHLDLHTRLDGDGGDLLDHIWCADEINHPFVSPHLKKIPGVGA